MGIQNQVNKHLENTNREFIIKEYKKYVRSFDSKFCKKKKLIPVSFKEWKKIQPEADNVLKEMEVSADEKTY